MPPHAYGDCPSDKKTFVTLIADTSYHDIGAAPGTTKKLEPDGVHRECLRKVSRTGEPDKHRTKHLTTGAREANETPAPLLLHNWFELI